MMLKASIDQIHLSYLLTPDMLNDILSTKLRSSHYARALCWEQIENDDVHRQSFSEENIIPPGPPPRPPPYVIFQDVILGFSGSMFQVSYMSRYIE